MAFRLEAMRRAGSPGRRGESSAGMAFQNVKVENPGLVSYRVYAVRLTARF